VAKAPKVERLGSGVLVAPTEVLTSCYLIDEATKVLVIRSNVERTARVRFLDRARDLCQLHIDDRIPDSKPAETLVPSETLEVGQAVFAISSPRGLEHTITKGIVSGLREMKGEKGKMIQIDAAVSAGSVGGGVFDTDAHLIGVITGGMKDAQNLNFAIPTEWIKDLPVRNRDRLADATDSGEARNNGTSTPAGLKNEPWLPRAGDRWTYALTNGKRKLRNVYVQVAESSGNTIREHVTVEGFKTFRTDRSVVVGEFDPVRFQDVLTLPGGYNMAEIAPYLPPSVALRQGQRWEAVSAEFSFSINKNSTVLFRVEVIGRETVRVPAGEFNTWKIQAIGDGPLWQSNRFKIICTYWYSPDVLRSVKMSVVYDTDLKTAQSQDVYELIAFEPVTAAGDPAAKR
jgi:hypothetical protein